MGTPGDFATTLEPGEAAEIVWDVLIVGAGPAGAVAARETARLGSRVLLIDKAAFPRYKVCGSCLSRRSLAVLESLGLGEVPGRLGAVPIENLLLAAGGRQARIDVRGGVAVSRAAFDAALVDAATGAGAAFLPSTEVRRIDRADDLVNVAVRSGGASAALQARIVILAGGLAGGLLAGEGGSGPVVKRASRIGAGAIVEGLPPFVGRSASYPPGTIHMACGRSGYVGLVRLEDGRLDVAAALDPAASRQSAGPGRAVAVVLAEAGIPPLPDAESLDWRGTPPLTRHATRPASHRVFMIGDAAGYVEPFTGEGIAWALVTGAAVAPLASRAAQGWHSAMAEHWCRVHRRLIVRRQRICRVVSQGLRRHRLTRAIVRVLSRFPGLAAPVVRRVHGRAGELVSGEW